MSNQARVARFIEHHDLATEPTYRLLDLVAEVGELSKDALTSSSYGQHPERLTMTEDELGDVLFATLALAEGLGIDAEEALDVALDKYEQRLDAGNTPASGR